MHRRSSLTAERLEDTLHEAADAMGRGEVPRAEKWQRFFVQALGTTKDQFGAFVAEYGIPSDMIDTIRDIVDARASDIHRYLLRQAASISKSHLVDFDYSVRLVLSSSTLHGDVYPIVLLKLYLSGDREVTLELNQAQLDEVLVEFDAIDATLSSLVPIASAAAP
ncbi:hypothetical protein H257_12149 [Aphanomyces astaci]|uniref:COMM domain-containing protein n=1 Tax=Aphanomyces astaci TaxID=112090 RepID=W4G1H2_APHAT|nr:hypothetical protein H257_12149 [Aphanomyces astaci]ETV72783.1 hypothetical protein H257_12149 [Aphanomyces astaci]|eukprot:XP_009837569.1 hypothetical protein H257_12149 [Aphanomyces astaci]